MVRHENIKSLLLLLTVIILISSVASNAQTNWINEERNYSAKFEFFKAEYKDSFSFDFGDFALAYSFNCPIGEKLSVKLEFPFSKAIGSPYIGIKSWENDSTIIGEIGLRYPIISDTENKGIGGTFTNYDRFDAFMDTYISFSGRIYMINEFWEYNKLRINFGPILLIPVRNKNDSFIETELFARYGLDLLSEYEKIGICFGLLGITHPTTEYFETDNTEILIGAGPNLNIRNINIGFRLNLPLGEGLDNFIDYVFTIYFHAGIKK